MNKYKNAVMTLSNDIISVPVIDKDKVEEEYKQNSTECFAPSAEFVNRSE